MTRRPSSSFIAAGWRGVFRVAVAWHGYRATAHAVVLRGFFLVAWGGIVARGGGVVASHAETVSPAIISVVAFS